MGFFMINISNMIAKNCTANALATQYALRINGLLALSTLGVLRRNLDTYLLCLRHGAEYVQNTQLTDPPEKRVSAYLDVMLDCTEKSWQDFRNNLQILLLAHDEALMWAATLDRTRIIH